MKKYLSILLTVIVVVSCVTIAYSTSLPSSYNAADHGYVTSVKHQGNWSTCGAFAAVSAIESDYIMKGYGTKDDTDFSEAYMYWFSLESQWDDESSDYYGDGIVLDVDSPYEVGLDYSMVLSALKTDCAIAYERDFPYDMDNDTMGHYTNLERFASGCNVRLDEMVAFTGNNSSGIKQWILDHGSVIIAYYSGTYYDGANGYEAQNTLSQKSNHAVTIVGWDDNKKIEGGSIFQGTQYGAWICKNSWGTDWGDDGYFWLPYNYKSISEIWGISIKNNDNCESRQSYNGYSKYLKLKEDYKQVANIFTADATGVISRVALFGTSGNATIKIYLDVNDGIPNSGIEYSVGTIEFPTEGFFSMDVPIEINITSGQKYSVVVTYSDIVPVENASNDYCSCIEGKSFVYNNVNNQWIDLSNSSTYGNVPIDSIILSTHTYSEPISKQPTCTACGYTMQYCTICGKVVREDTKALGHDWTEWNTITEPTEKTLGTYTRNCKQCLIEEKKYADINGAEWDYDEYYAQQLNNLSFFERVQLFFVLIASIFSNIIWFFNPFVV